jgi:hypothetical protein
MTISPLEGGCACGAIRYRCDAEPVMMFKCHCRDCQRATGGPFVAALLVPVKAFKWVKGEPTFHAVPSARGGTNTRSFCGVCGSRLTGGQRGHLWPFIGITAASLDDPSRYKPQMHLFASQAQPWDEINDDLPKHEQYAPRPGDPPSEAGKPPA